MRVTNDNEQSFRTRSNHPNTRPAQSKVAQNQGAQIPKSEIIFNTKGTSILPAISRFGDFEASHG
jgi:hypothetical protein